MKKAKAKFMERYPKAAGSTQSSSTPAPLGSNSATGGSAMNSGMDAPMPTATPLASTASQMSASRSATADSEAMATAEREKSLGNDALQKGQYEEAILHYNKAIEIWPRSAVYYANR